MKCVWIQVTSLTCPRMQEAVPIIDYQMPDTLQQPSDTFHKMNDLGHEKMCLDEYRQVLVLSSRTLSCTNNHWRLHTSVTSKNARSHNLR